MGFKFMVNWHHEYVAWLIDQVVQQKIPNLVINVPPGAGKTELTTNLLARGLALNPRSRFLYLSFSQSLVEDVSSTARNIVKSEDFQRMWPVDISKSTDAKASWKTTVEGYEAGMFTQLQWVDRLQVVVQVHWMTMALRVQLFLMTL